VRLATADHMSCYCQLLFQLRVELKLAQSVLSLGLSSAAAQAVQQDASSLGFSHLCLLVCTEAPMLLMGRHLLQRQAAGVSLTADSRCLMLQ